VVFGDKRRLLVLLASLTLFASCTAAGVDTAAKDAATKSIAALLNGDEKTFRTLIWPDVLASDRANYFHELVVQFAGYCGKVRDFTIGEGRQSNGFNTHYMQVQSLAQFSARTKCRGIDLRIDVELLGVSGSWRLISIRSNAVQ
jgi:hypothetical protein